MALVGPGATREHIVQAADRLFYERGYDSTSFADIAQAVGVSRGNFYHHFKTKDEILGAVIQSRLQATQGLLHGWELQAAQPLQRLRSFVHMIVANQTQIMQFGCPVGSLCGELARLGHPLQDRANALFVLFRAWLRLQFSQLGYPPARADAQALHLLMRSQGVATLAQSFRDEAFVRREVRQMEAWLRTCAAEASATT